MKISEKIAAVEALRARLRSAKFRQDGTERSDVIGELAGLLADEGLHDGLMEAGHVFSVNGLSSGRYDSALQQVDMQVTAAIARLKNRSDVDAAGLASPTGSADHPNMPSEIRDVVVTAAFVTHAIEALAPSISGNNIVRVTCAWAADFGVDVPVTETPIPEGMTKATALQKNLMAFPPHLRYRVVADLANRSDLDSAPKVLELRKKLHNLLATREADKSHSPFREATLTNIPRAPKSSDVPNAATSRQPRAVFVVHGHDDVNKLRLKDMLRDKLRCEPIILSQQPGQGRHILDKFEEEASAASFAFVLLSPDDVIKKEGTMYAQARPNVIFELGWFYGRLGRSRVCILSKRGTEIHSDLAGISRIEFSESVEEKFLEIERELGAALK